MEAILSVVIPVYNCEKYLNRAVESVLKQPMSEKIEIIIVDDGSTDKSGEIAERIKCENNNVKVYHKENGGCSSARNVGIEKATGKYICFLDSDDWWEKNFLDEQLMADLIAGDNVDAWEFSYRSTTHDYKLEKINRIKNETIHYGKNGLGRFDWSHHCAFFFRRSILIENEIRYPEKSFTGGDGVVVEMILYYVRVFKKIDKIIFNYYENFSSLQHTTKHEKHIRHRYDGVCYEKEYFEKRGEKGVDLEERSLWYTASTLGELCGQTSYSKSKSIIGEFIYGQLEKRPDLLPEVKKWSVWKSVNMWEKGSFRYWVKKKITIGTLFFIKNVSMSIPGINSLFNYLYNRFYRGFIPVKCKK